MTVLVRKSSVRLLLKWTQRGLLAGATVMLGYCAFVLSNTWMFQHRQRQTLERLIEDARPENQALLKPVSPKIGIEKLGLDVTAPEGLIGRMEVRRLGLSLFVVEGTDESTLRRAAGHIAGTALPGQVGNIGIAAHRDTFFRPLRKVRRDDVITLTTPGGEYRYRVVSTKIVRPEDVAVLSSDGNEILTLVTCYPFYFVGAAPNRFIVRAARIL
ncbi:MAG TPA: class D sortase [Bryobacteraceae bacterium]|jgi:sortase A